MNTAKMIVLMVVLTILIVALVAAGGFTMGLSWLAAGALIIVSAGVYLGWFKGLFSSADDKKEPELPKLETELPPVEEVPAVEGAREFW